MLRVLAACAVIATAGCEALVNPEEFRAAEAKKAADAGDPSANPNQVVCRRITVPSSRVPKKDCRTRAEWAQMQDETQQRLREFEDKGVRQDMKQ